MGETNHQQPAGVIEQVDLARTAPVLQNKVDLLLHFLRNSRKPVALIGSQEGLLTTFNMLQKEGRFLHSSYAIQSSQEASLPSVFGLLFHLLSISEHEVAGADPEQLLIRHLAVLEKNSQVLLLFVCSASKLDLESRTLLAGLAERHPALRLVFAFNEQENVLVEDRGFHLLMLPKQENGAFRQGGKSPSQLELKKFKLGVILVALLIAILLAMVGFLPEMSKQAGEVESSRLEQGNVDDIEGAKVSGLADLKSKEPIKPPSLPDEGGLVIPVFPKQQENVKVTHIPPKTPIQNEEALKPFGAIEIDGTEQKQKEPVFLQKEEKKPVSEGLVAHEKGLVDLVEAAPAVVPAKSDVVVVEEKKPLEVIHQEKWLLSQPKEKFTLQIMGGRDKLSIVRYAKTQKNRSLFAYYRAIKKGKNWYPLLYGIYPSKESAKEAINKLPQTLQKLKPWARSLESVQMEIHEVAGKKSPN